jgi:hypothetical protein
MRKKNTKMRKGRSALPLKPATQSRLYPLFLVLLPILFTCVVFFGYSQAQLLYYKNGVQAMDRQLDTVFQILSLFHERVEEGSLTFTEAQQRVKDLIAGPKRPDGTRDSSAVRLTMGEGENLFAFNSQGTLTVHAEWEGQNLNNTPTPEGRYLIREVLNEGKHHLSYQWQPPDGASPESRISVVRYFPQWDWYVGIVTSEERFYQQFSSFKTLLVLLVAGSYLITAVLIYLTQRQEKLLLSSKRRGEQLAEANQSILKSLAVALEERDSYTSGHSQRVAYYMRVIGKQMGMDEAMLDTVYTGGLLHDIGKIGIEDSILLKPGRLTDEEYEIIKAHPVRGEALLRKLFAQAGTQDSQQIETILVITRHHHERFDGKGYPDGLKGEDIPLVVRISAVADAFDAMTSSRAYRKGLSFSKACDEIIRNTGTQFCPQVVDAFFQSVTEETFFHAHHISRANQLLLDRFDEAREIALAQPPFNREPGIPQ